MIAAVVLAAGTSSRMGRPKQIILLDGVPMLQKVLGTFRRSKVGRVVVVLGAHESEVRKRVNFTDEVVVVNARFSEGMSGSLKLGIRQLGKETNAAVISLGDQPFVLPSTIDRLVEEYERTRARIVIPTYRGTRGNPVLFASSLFPQIEEIRGDVGAKSVVEENASEVLEVEVSDMGVLVDIDAPSDIDRATAVRPGRTRGPA